MKMNCKILFEVALLVGLSMNLAYGCELKLSPGGWNSFPSEVETAGDMKFKAIDVEKATIVVKAPGFERTIVLQEDKAQEFNICGHTVAMTGRRLLSDGGRYYIKTFMRISDF
jgi:hypothetical protein